MHVFRAGPCLGYCCHHAPKTGLQFKFCWIYPELLPNDEGYADYVEHIKSLKSYTARRFAGISLRKDLVR